MQKESLVNSTTYIHQKKPRLRDRTDRAWFRRLVWHPARKQRGSILTTLEPVWGDLTSHESSSVQHTISSTSCH